MHDSITIKISGPSGSGKTSLQNWLSELIEGNSALDLTQDEHEFSIELNDHNIRMLARIVKSR